jgi:hypothetical protein
LLLLFALINLSACDKDRPENSELAVAVPSANVAVEEGSRSPLVTLTATMVSQPVSPVHPMLKRYRGHSFYGTAFPQFEIQYDPAQWILLQNDGDGGHRLEKRQIPGCQLRLRASPTSSDTVSSVHLAGRTWMVGPLRGNLLMYYFNYDRIAYIFYVRLPRPESDTEMSACQTAAEEVIDSFIMVTD